MMETIEIFSDFLRKLGTPNFLAIGIVIVVMWILISGFLKGWKKGRKKKESQGPDDTGKDSDDF